MSNPWVGLNIEDDHLARLPQPFRFINKVMDELLCSVDDEIFKIEERKKEEIFEYNLATSTSTYQMSVPALVPNAACVGTVMNSGLKDYMGTQLVGVGSTDGQVFLLDVAERRLLDSKQMFTVGELLLFVGAFLGMQVSRVL